MPYLEIRLPHDGPRTIELDKHTALSVGQHPSNDICIDGDDVELMHCRVSWNKKSGFEVVSAAIDGVEVNGNVVQKSALASGDVMRIGRAKITFIDGDPVKSEAESRVKDELVASTFGLRPLTDEFSAPLPPIDDVPLTADEILADEAPLTADEILPDEPEKKSRRKKSSRSKERDRSDDRKSRRKEQATNSDGALDDSEWPNLSAEDLAAAGEAPREPRKPSVSAKSPDEPAPAEEPLPPRRHHRHVRPGERDPVRSPLVQSLGAGAAILALVGLTFYFILGRQTTQQKFDEAKALMEEGKFTQAIRAFEDFLVVYPRDSLSDEAQINMWISRVDRPISGASPNWTEGLTELEGFINARRDSEDFEQQHDVIRQRAETIAEGAAVTAGKAYDRNLLAVSDTARNIIRTFQPDEAITADLMKRIETERRKSDAAILKHEALMAALSEIDKALQNKQPIAALGIRRELVSRYPEFASDPKVVAKLTETLTAEREAVTASDEPVEALTDDHQSAFPAPLVLTFHARSRTDEVSVGRTVYGLAKDCCYAVDSITGEPVWRRVVGWDTPFFPVPVTTSVHALLLFDTNHDELVCVDQQSGDLLWRQPSVRGVNGPPLVEEGQAYVVSSSGTLSKVELESGRVISQLNFSQSLLSPPAALNDDARLVLCGNQEVVYTLTKRPFECVAVSYLGQKPESVAAPVLPMGALVMIAENLPNERSQLHVMDTRSEGQLTESMSTQVPGHVVDSPVIRGRDVFVPSTGERVSAFSATDEQGQPPLTEGARYETEGAALSPMYLATGPDRQVWMASRSLRKLQLLTDTIEPGSKVIDLGIATQELQQIGKQIYVGSRQPYSHAVTLFQTDRDQLTSQWQIVIGGELLSFGTFPNQQGLVAVSESGDVFRINESQLHEGGFLTDSTVRLKVPEGLATPMQATQSGDGRVLVWCGNPMPQIWVLNRLGQVERNFPVPSVLECAPTQVGKYLALPLSGRVQLISENGTASNVQEFTLPQSDEVSDQWRQLVGIDESSLIAVNNSGALRLLKLQTSPQPFLQQAGDFHLGAAMDFDIALSEGRIAAAVGNRLIVADAATLEPVAETQLEAAVSNDVWQDKGIVFVEIGGKKLVCFDVGDGLVQKWSVELPEQSLAGSPAIAGETVVAALRNGVIMLIDAQTGQLRDQKPVNQALSSGPRLVSSQLVVATVDGGLVSLGSLPGAP